MTTLPTRSASEQSQDPRRFHVHAVTDDGIMQVSVQGDIDLATADRFRDAVLKAVTVHTGPLRIDLSAVTFLDSTGIGALVAIRNCCVPRHVPVLEYPPPQVRRILEVTGLDTAFTIEPGPSERDGLTGSQFR